ncbi:MAG: cytochrome c biogenesis protein CcsA, partial [Deltaproteobacteria bacterium]|nr:cytochrome c biogenesis protein CcsA [Deltaproteobacteria bacterium]
LGYVLHASALVHVCPIYSLPFFLSMATLFATGIYLLARRRWHAHALGVLVAPVGLVVSLGTHFASFAPPAVRLPASFIALHVLANLLGEALFLLAFGAAALYLWRERRLKRKRLPLASRLPPLDALDATAHRFLLAGFPLLTAGVATGTVWSRQLIGAPADVLLRAAFGYATWLLFAAVLLLRVLCGWRGRRAAWGTIAGFACAVVALVVFLARPLLHAARLGG